MNFDGGHYFLTLLAPIKREIVQDKDGADRSPLQILRQTLATLPVALQDAQALASGVNSPFAAVPNTHFLRFFIIDELRFNGRRPSNPILDLVTNVDMLRAENVDELIDPFLVMAVDFDAADGSDASLRAYTDQLWLRAEDTLRRVFGNCVGFDAVTDSAGFFRYIKACQVRTTMPFTDYWTIAMPRWALPGLIGKAYAGIGLAALVIAASGLWPWGPMRLIGCALLVALVVGFILVWRVGSAVWPKAPHSDLRSVLKALYTQQQFARFATRSQGLPDEALYKAFGAFCTAHRPSDLTGPTQGAGTPFSRQDPT